MKKVTLFLFLSIVSCKKSENDLDTMNLSGKIKSLSENCYGADEKFGEIQKVEDYFFRSENIFEFNEKGFIEKVKCVTCGSIDFYLYENDTLKSITEKSEEHRIKSKIVYLHSSNQIVENWYNSDGILSLKVVKYIDENGKIKSSQRHSVDSTKNYSLEFKYDKDQRLIEEIWPIRLDKNKREKYIYSYDSKDNIIKKIWMYPYEGANGPIESVYEYQKIDEEGNWTVRIEYKDGIPESYTERQITYY